VLSRRDLFDARFQLVSQASGVGEDEIDDHHDGQNSAYPTEGNASANALRFVDAPSDLVRGVYEGGLKTWECSIDLASYLLDHPDIWKPSGSAIKRTVEVSWINPHVLNSR
jgi:protein-histidine N-methyltransferase